MTKLDLFLKCKDGSAYEKSNNEIYHINRMQAKRHDHLNGGRENFRKNSEKKKERIQHYFMIKTLNIPGIEENFLNKIRTLYVKHMATIIFKNEGLKFFSLRQGKRQGYTILTFLFTIVLEVLARAFRQEKKKCSPNRRSK
uniref:Reverse transcriptase domain-containing protein n=1 Tax=Sus scrofa TaxID=9823 RepID=A0A8D1VBL8_PIG